MKVMPPDRNPEDPAKAGRGDSRIPPPGNGRSDSPLPGARSALILLLLINLFNYIDRQVLAAVVPWVKTAFFGEHGEATQASLTILLTWCQRHLGFKPENALIGVLSMAFMAVYMVGAPVFGKLAERRSRWVLIAVGVTLWSLASGASGLAAGFMALLLTRCFVGVGEAAYGPVAPALISDLYPINMRGRVLAWFYMAIPVGSALGYVVGDAVARSGIGEWGHGFLGLKAESWRWAFYLVVVPGLLLGLLSLLRRDPPRGQTDLGHGITPVRTTWRDYAIFARTPSYVFCTIGMTAMTFAIGGIAFWMPYYLQQKAGAPASATTIFGAITVVAGLSATLLGGMAGDALRRRFPGSYFLVSGTAMLVGVPFVLLTLRSTFPWIWIWIFVTCFCLFFNTGPTNTILVNVLHPTIRPAGFALNIFIIHALGDVISPVLIGVISDRTNMTLALSVVGLMFLVAGAAWLAGSRFLGRDTALAPTRLGPAPVRGMRGGVA
jgi:MFS transporter, Spinster family, sphingosine-1-phosphate transporter